MAAQETDRTAFMAAPCRRLLAAIVGLVENHLRRPRAKPIEIRIFLDRRLRFPSANRDNAGMKRPASPSASIAATWECARSGDLRGATEAARGALRQLAPDAAPGSHVELHLVIASCAMRQGD